jgi:hypothetical protein
MTLLRLIVVCTVRGVIAAELTNLPSLLEATGKIFRRQVTKGTSKNPAVKKSKINRMAQA